MPDGGGGSQQTSTEPWKRQKPYLLTGFQQAEENVLNRPLEYFPGQTYVPFSPESEAALTAATGRAQAGSPLLGQAQGYTGDVLSGQYLSPDSNPFFGDVTQSIMSQVQPAVAQQFAGAGRSGASPLAAEALGRGVAAGVAPYAYGAYGQERGMQQQAAAAAPGLAQADYMDPAQLLQIGQAREGMSGQALSDQIARFNFGQSEPTNRLAQYMGLIQGNYGGTTTASAPAVNPLLLGTGAALSLAGMPTAGGGSLGGNALGK